MTSSERIRLILLFGGRSAEHDVSRVTARHVLAAADPAKYELVPIGISRSGEWHRADSALARRAEGPDALPAALDVEGPTVNPFEILTASGSARTVVFPLLHGPMGEDGTLQGLLTMLDVPFVGSGVLGSAVSMDKITAKRLADAAGIAQARWRGFHLDDLGTDRDAVFADLIEHLGFPMFVKPANMGSSIGVSKVRETPALGAAIDLAGTHDEWIVVEEAIVGREIEVAVLGRTNSARASVPGEIVPGAEFYDFEDKYVDGAADLRIPAPLSEEATDEVRQLACEVFRLLRADGLARVDFFYEENGRGFLLNELNTIPGFTPISMYPRLWQASGLTYGALLDELIALALQRWP